MNYQRKEMTEVFRKANYIFKVLYCALNITATFPSNREIQIIVRSLKNYRQ